jgi:type I restriction enzyme S subunit
MAKQNKPAIRFKGFTDAWEQRKLGEVVKEVTRNDPTSEAPIMMITANNGFIEQSERYAFDNAGESLKKYILLQKGELAYNHGASKLRPFGSCFALTTAESARIPFVYHCFSAENQNAEFLSIELNGSEVESQLRKIVSSGARMDGLLNISFDEYSTVTVLLPDIKEQEHIADFFRNLDHLITLHQRKYDKLQVLKKAMLEKMFPKNGSSVPEIRFKGFTDAWEQRKLGDNIVEYTEVTTENNQYPPLTSSRKGIFLQTEYFAGNQIASDDNTGYNIVPYGYFTYRHMSDDEVFHFNINDIVEKGIVSTLYPVFTTDENLDSRYLQYQLNYGHEFAKFAILQKQGGSRTYMYLNKLRQLHLTMPNHVEEQKAISSFFMNLDHLITLHQRELEKLQNIKKSMLEKMFV